MGCHIVLHVVVHNLLLVCGPVEQDVSLECPHAPLVGEPLAHVAVQRIVDLGVAREIPVNTPDGQALRSVSNLRSIGRSVAEHPAGHALGNEDLIRSAQGGGISFEHGKIENLRQLRGAEYHLLAHSRRVVTLFHGQVNLILVFGQRSGCDVRRRGGELFDLRARQDTGI